MLSLDSFLFIDGFDGEQWRERLVEPGGGDLINWRRENTSTWRANAQQVRREPVGKRWRKAQAAEAAFWRSWRQNVLYQHISLSDFWEEVVAKTGGPLPAGKTLDVGCGPVSVLNFCRHQQTQPIGLDPLAALYAQEGLIECKSGWRPMPLINLTAERLPFADNSLDHVICFNVLDHVADAPAVLKEMWRVLKIGATLRVYVHTFAGWIKRMLFFDTPHVYHWDHHEFEYMVENCGFEIRHRLKEAKTFDLPPGWWGKWRYFAYWFATKVAFTSYFLLQKTAK